MTEKLKYKVGDKVLIEAEVTERYKGIGDLRDQIEGFDIKMSSKIIMPKPKLPQEMMDWYEKHDDKGWFFEEWIAIGHKITEVNDWLCTDDYQLSLERHYALATLITFGPQAVEVEKEKRYRVKIKRLENTDIALQYLVYDIYGYRFEINTLVTKDSQYEFTKQELIAAGFEGVFDNPMFEVEEVE